MCYFLAKHSGILHSSSSSCDICPPYLLSSWWWWWEWTTGEPPSDDSSPSTLIPISAQNYLTFSTVVCFSLSCWTSALSLFLSTCAQSWWMPAYSSIWSIWFSSACAWKIWPLRIIDSFSSSQVRVCWSAVWQKKRKALDRFSKFNISGSREAYRKEVQEMVFSDSNSMFW